MKIYGEYQISLSQTGGPIGTPNYSSTFDRFGDIVSFRCFVDKIQVGGGGHDKESARQVEALLSGIEAIPNVVTEDSQMMDSNWNRLDIKHGNSGMFFEWYDDCPSEWPSVCELTNLIVGWSKKHWHKHVV
jgi:hypothetical protein